MKKILLVCLALFIFALLFTACGDDGKTPESSAQDTTPSDPWQAELVALASDHYEDYVVNFEPLSATLYKNGEATSIAINDERLVRLVNYFIGALSSDQCSYVQSYVSPNKSGILEDFRLELTYEPQGDVAPGAYENAPTKFDMIVVTNSSFDFTLIDHDRTVIYGDIVYPFLAAKYLPFDMSGNCLEMFGF